MRKPNLERIGNVAKHVGEFVVYGLALSLLAAPSGFEVRRSKPDYISRYSDYGDAIEAIMNSNMLSSHKKDAVSALKRDGDYEFYRSIISIVRDSGTLSSIKVDMIKELSKN